jgi:hypothetical protein
LDVYEWYSDVMLVRFSAPDASALASRVLGDPYLGHKIRMMAVHAELQEAIALAAYVQYYPFEGDFWPQEYFGIYDSVTDHVTVGPWRLCR